MPNLKLLASAVADILKGNSQILGSYPNQDNAHFSSGWEFMISLEKPQLQANFEVDSFSHCINIKGNLQILGTSLAQGHAHFFFWM